MHWEPLVAATASNGSANDLVAVLKPLWLEAIEETRDFTAVTRTSEKSQAADQPLKLSETLTAAMASADSKLARGLISSSEHSEIINSIHMLAWSQDGSEEDDSELSMLQMIHLVS